jgi:cobalamin synthase
MLKAFNAIALTLLVAIVAVILGGLVVREVPALSESGLHQVTVAAWVSGLLSWGMALMVARQYKAQAQKAGDGGKQKGGKRNGRAIGVTVTMLAVATAAVFALDRFGNGLW